MAKRLMLAFLVTGALVTLGFLLEHALTLFHPAPTLVNVSTISHDSQPQPAATLATALEIDGTVEYRSPGAAWHPLIVGSTIDISDEVRTGPTSRARLQLGSQVTVQLWDRTCINVAQLSETLSRIRLNDGRVVSEVRAAKGFVFRVQVQGSSAQAETHAGRFAVLRRSGAPSVFAAESGALNVTGATGSVNLAAGEQTLVADNSEPSAPMKLPSSLLLKLGQSPPALVRKRLAKVHGETSPGAIVSVGKQTVVPDAAGRFTSTVALIDGPNEIVVEVEDVAGRKQVARMPIIIVDAKAPRVAGKVVW